MSGAYPRPQMERDEWVDLCGPWDYAITDSARRPDRWDGVIKVPFSPETPASGVVRCVKPGEYLWYRRQLALPPAGGRVLLNFGAVDQIAVIWVNGREVGSHYGGYTPFSVDITDALDADGCGELLVAVQDDSDRSPLAHGKQKLKRGGRWYTPQSGIWQPVWAERVPGEYIRSLRITPRYDEGVVEIEAVPGGTVHFQGADYPCPARVPVPGFVPWTPERPKLYDFTVTLGEDEVRSYFAMRKFSVAEGKLCLNNEPYFHNGVLDQGYNPGGYYTPIRDEDMVRDIATAKSMGFNTIRKHQKVEPARWYYHCDRLGMLVWQDMPCGGGPYDALVVTAPKLLGGRLRDDQYRRFGRADVLGRRRFLDELREMIAALYNCPCICLWTPFSMGWGQFDAAKTAELVRSLDDTRLIDHASGWHDQGYGDIRSDNVYFRRYTYKPDPAGRAVVLSGFGGINLRVWGHTWNDKDFGYNSCVDEQDLENKLWNLYQKEIAPAKKAGLAAAIYTQLTDVEDDINGLITYDRDVVKVQPETMRRIVDV